MAANFANARAGVYAHDLVQVRRRKDGSEVGISLTLSPLHDIDGALIGVSAVARDISELRRANERLRHSESQLAEAQRVAQVGSWWRDLITGEADRLDTIFEPFEQAGASTRKTHGGTGLGPSISRALCAAMGCSLSVESIIGVGSTFRVLLPADVPHGPGMARAA